MATGEKQRIDKWLFFARVVKSRSLAAKLATGGKVRVNKDKIDQASHNVKPGDVLTITMERRVLVYRVLEAGARRGPAEEARTLYEDLSPPPLSKDERPVLSALPVRDPGSGRPTKRERRETDRLTGGFGVDDDND
ncbi:MAG: RNA-binding S4 domain-containing protein [Phyllobacterium sp.]